MNAAIFYDTIKKEADESSDQRTREFKAWWYLFTHSLDSPTNYNSFINEYNQSITILKEAKSKGVEDEILLRALLLRAIQCDEYEDVKKIITKDLNMKPGAILNELKTHHLALESEQNWKTVGKASTKSIRRGKTNDKYSDSETSSKKSNDSKWRTPFIPHWPSGLIDVCTNSLWSQLNLWKSLVNKPNKNSNEKRRLQDFKINCSQDNSDSERSSHRDRHSRNEHNRGRGRGFDRKRGRSSKSNRYSSDSRRNSRRSGRRSPSPDHSTSTHSDYESDISSKKPSKKIRRSSKRNDETDSSPPNKDRSARKILGGILKRGG